MLIQFQNYLTLENIYFWSNFGVIPFWLLLIIVPNSKITGILVNSILIPLILSSLYVYLGYQMIVAEENLINIFNLYLSIDNLYSLLSSEKFLAFFWLHFLALNIFLGSWVSKDSRSLHNARLEGIEKKVSFKKLIINSRAVIPCSGYYEWKKSENKKIPHYFTKVNDQDIFLAGIHDSGQFCIITREATEKNTEIHHRQPVIIPKSQINNYFNLNNNAVEFLNKIKPPELRFYEISTDVNNPGKNDPTIIYPITK